MPRNKLKFTIAYLGTSENKQKWRGSGDCDFVNVV